MSPRETWDESKALERVRKWVSGELLPATPLPGDDEDLVNSGAVDSMGWVGILPAVEEATAIRNFGNPWPERRPQTIRSIVEAIQEGLSQRATKVTEARVPETMGVGGPVSLGGWGYSLGSLRIEAGQIEQECRLPPGTIRDRAGIECVCRASHEEDEFTLAQQAAERAIEAASLDPEKVDLLVATSATSLTLPSLSATLHSRLLLRESCGALDIGGACVGIIHALATAKALLSTSPNGVSLVVASEVNSRRLSSPEVPGEFRGLFGDGACAFVLGRSESGDDQQSWRLGDFIWGCSGTFASSLRLALRETGELDVSFKGDQLATAAVAQLDRVLDGLENLSGKPRAEVDYFALHEPNPRVVGVFAQRASIPLEKIAFTSKTCGNLGSATCGVSLCTALSTLANRKASYRPLIFIAAVGPGLVWGGGYLD